MCMGRFRSFVILSSMYSAELALFFMSSFSSLSMFFASSAPFRMFRGTELSFITWFSVSMIACISSVIFLFSSPRVFFETFPYILSNKFYIMVLMFFLWMRLMRWLGFFCRV